MYFDDSKNLAGFDFPPATTKLDMTFPQFAKTVRDMRKDLKEDEKPDKYYYLQQTLNEGTHPLARAGILNESMQNTGVGPQIVEDFTKFDWDWVYGWQKYMGWGKMKFNTLWVGMKGVFTQAHYDEAHNFFAQIHGRKKFVLFHPSDFSNLYVYPFHHPADRQSQVRCVYQECASN